MSENQEINDASLVSGEVNAEGGHKPPQPVRIPVCAIRKTVGVQFQPAAGTYQINVAVIRTPGEMKNLCANGESTPFLQNQVTVYFSVSSNRNGRFENDTPWKNLGATSHGDSIKFFPANRTFDPGIEFYVDFQINGAPGYFTEPASFVNTAGRMTLKPQRS